LGHVLVFITYKITQLLGGRFIPNICVSGWVLGYFGSDSLWNNIKVQ